MVTEWQEKKLGDIAEIRMCKRIFADQTTPTGEIPFFKIGTFGKEPDAYISRSLYGEYRSKYSFPNKGDILLSAAGTLGRTVVYDGKPAYFQDSNIVWLEIDTSQICNEYLNHCYQVMVWASPEGSTISRLYNSIIRDTDIKLPPLPEQRRIAEALSDTDALIAALEKLIAKKRAIKQGAMQELLTGKRRLPGFSGDIKLLELQELCSVFCDGDWIEAKDQSDRGVRLIQTGNIGSGYFINKSDKKRFISEDTFNNLNCVEVFPGDVLVSRLPDPAGRACIVPPSVDRMITAVDCTIIRFVDYNPILFVMFAQTEQYQRQVDLLMAGSTRQRIGRKELGGIKIPVFLTTQEQTAIATILSDMDAEIDALTAKLNKVKNIKHGMMAELLTGRIRLPDQEAVVHPVTKIIKLPKRKPETTAAPEGGHSQQFDDAVMIAGIVHALYSDRFLLGRKKIQKCLYLLRRHQDESTAAFKKKAAGPYADAVRYKGGEPIAIGAKYITTTVTDKGTIFARGENISQALDYIQNWGKQANIQWVADKLKFKKVDELELLATVDMAICDLEEAGTPVSVASIKHLIATNAEWKAKLKKQTFSDANIARAIRELQTLL